MKQEPMSGLSLHYKSFMLRLWKANEEGISMWRASLVEAVSGKQHYFASLAALFRFLLNETQTEVDKEKSRTKQS